MRVPVAGSDRPMLIDGWNGWLQQYSWSLDGNGYAHTYLGRIDGRNSFEYAHTMIVCPPDGLTVDHIDRDPLNNAEANLRLATKAQQMWNMGLTVRNTTGLKGVVRRRNRWLVYIGHENRKFYVGSYSTPEEAAQAYDQRALELKGAYACTNQMLGLLP